mmetsp:Transcript_19711/g.35436  ORF Transcript_19711/g.35436 Transcript_19711/m.35436 type:complete len:224 (-) Transcript_19711:1780-2451(-)
MSRYIVITSILILFFNLLSIKRNSQIFHNFPTIPYHYIARLLQKSLQITRQILLQIHQIQKAVTHDGIGGQPSPNNSSRKRISQCEVGAAHEQTWVGRRRTIAANRETGRVLNEARAVWTRELCAFHLVGELREILDQISQHAILQPFCGISRWGIQHGINPGCGIEHSNEIVVRLDGNDARRYGGVSIGPGWILGGREGDLHPRSARGKLVGSLFLRGSGSC